jgi:hypothetical protein
VKAYRAITAARDVPADLLQRYPVE